MNTMKRMVLALVVALPVSLLGGGVARASDPVTQTYHGVFTTVDHGICTPAVTEEPTVTGVWQAAVHGTKSVTVTVDMFVDGKHHVSFGVPVAQTRVDGTTFSADIPIGSMTLTVSLVGSTFSYKLVPYDAFGYVCDQVTYSGVLVR